MPQTLACPVRGLIGPASGYATFIDLPWSKGRTDVTSSLIIAAMLAGTATAGTYEDTVLADSPLGYWRLDETVGNEVENLGVAGAALNGTLAGDYDLGASSYIDDGHAIGFSRGTDGGRIEWGNALEGMFLDGGSWELWLHPDDLIGQRIFGYTSTWAVDGQWMMFIEASGQLAFDLYSGGSNRCNGDLTTGDWHHVVATWDGDLLSLYVNGDLVDTVTADALSLNSEADVLASVASDTLGFDGQLDEIAVYDIVLSADQVLAHYQSAQDATGDTDAEVDDTDAGDGGSKDCGCSSPKRRGGLPGALAFLVAGCAAALNRRRDRA